MPQEWPKEIAKRQKKKKEKKRKEIVVRIRPVNPCAALRTLPGVKTQ